MALTTCPKCQKQVSEQAAFCPNCGSPLSCTVSEPPSYTESTFTPPVPVCESVGVASPVAPPEKAKKRIWIISAVAVACIALIAAAIFIVSKSVRAKARKEYIANLQSFASTVLQGAVEAENVCNLTKNVWYDTIYKEYDVDTIAYTYTNGEFNDDFNVSLQSLYASEDMKTSVAKIKSNREEVDEIYKKLLEPDSEFETCFSEVEELYDVYRQFTNLAISPTGSLKTYAEDFGDYDEDFMAHYDKLKLLIPEE